jgi:endonuclease YncB( thermonuclease family)
VRTKQIRWGCLGPVELVLLIVVPFGVWMFLKYGNNVGNARVTRIEDANTVVVQDDKGNEETVHLAGIDAPERGQADGLYAQEQLAKLIAGKKLRVDPDRQLPNGTVLANLYIAKEWINLEMVQTGFAWVAPSENRDPTLLVAENRARVERRGLWSQADPTAPWIWRQTHQQTQAEAANDDRKESKSP